MGRACGALPAVLALSLALGGCSPSEPAPLAVDPPGGAGCARLHRALPDSLDGRSRRDTRPASERTAAWGDPAVVLRCGVPRPGALTPTSEVIEVDGVSWFLEESPRGFLFTTVGLTRYVEVLVPSSTPRTEAVNPLVDLAPALTRIQ